MSSGYAAHHAFGRDEAARDYTQVVLGRTASALVNAVDARDEYTHSHSHEVADLCVAMGEHLGLGDERIELLRVAALLHDVGKIGIPDNVLGKNGNLDEQEWSQVRLHPVLGEKIMANGVDQRILPWVRGHHERWDGGGYPDGLMGWAIPFEARIIAICDAFHAMTSDRPYRVGRPRVLAMAVIVSEAGKQFDPKLVEAFKHVVERFDFSPRERTGLRSTLSFAS